MDRDVTEEARPGITRPSRRIKHPVFYAVFGLGVLLFAVIGVANYANRGGPTYWGTFTETSTHCDDPIFHTKCTSTGNWVSDDGSIVKDQITLDGRALSSGGTVRASYHPVGPFGDNVNNVVHTATWSGAGLWMPWVFVAVIVAIGWWVRRGLDDSDDVPEPPPPS